MTGSPDAVTVATALREFIVSDLLFDRTGVDLGEDTDLFGGGLVDSVGLMRLVMHLERSYRIGVADEDLVPENFGTVAALARFATEKARRAE